MLTVLASEQEIRGRTFRFSEVRKTPVGETDLYISSDGLEISLYYDQASVNDGVRISASEMGVSRILVTDDVGEKLSLDAAEALVLEILEESPRMAERLQGAEAGASNDIAPA